MLRDLVEEFIKYPNSGNREALREEVSRVEEALAQAEQDRFFIQCLHSGGVDDWEWYSESLEPYYERYA